MSILIKLFLVAYLLAMVVATIFSVVSILTAIFVPDCSMKRMFSTMFHQRKHI